MLHRGKKYDWRHICMKFRDRYPDKYFSLNATNTNANQISAQTIHAL